MRLTLVSGPRRGVFNEVSPLLPGQGRGVFNEVSLFSSGPGSGVFNEVILPSLQDLGEVSLMRLCSERLERRE